MSSSEKKDDPFAYESSVHSSNVLLRLDSQRQQGVLCDITVVVGDQRFQAHRAVLAASSGYFLSRVVQPCHADFVITLPEEVTVKGFLPLLQFAYTSKLLVNRDNILEIRKVAKLLEIHDVEETCFEFLKLKFQDNKAEQSDFSRKKWCKTFCPKVSGQQNDSGKVSVHEVEDLWKGEFSPTLKCPVENVSPFPESPKQPCETFCFGRDTSPGFSSLCPKYRKFQKACRSDRVRSTSTCSSNPDAQSPSPAPPSDASETVSQSKPQVQDVPQAKYDVEITTACPQDTDLTYQNLTSADNKVAMAAAYPPCFPLGTPDFSSVPFQCVYPPYRGLSYSDIPSDSSAAGLPEGSNSRQSSIQAAEMPSPEMVAEPQVAASGKPPLNREPSNVEREVAEHLAKGFWSELYPADFSCPQDFNLMTSRGAPQESNVDKRAECPWLGISISNEAPERTFTALNPVSCPFIGNLSNDVRSSSPRPNSRECTPSNPPEKCMYACSINLEDETDSDSEDDSIESPSAKELECERTLPFNAEKIISLSRYDFQSLVKMHNLSPEQLDCIHDIRRRSKNRIAAQRCRKRKLDCLQTLESEIQKLHDEKMNLLKERDLILSKLGETKQNLSGLCRQMWQDASLTQEHLHMLAKFSGDKCPLSLAAAEKASRRPQCEAMPQGYSRGLHHGGEGNPVLQSASPRPILPPAAHADPCQPMTPNSTTDEQP